MVGLSAWGLAIDFGTSFTATAVVHDSTVEIVEVEDEARFPSWVLAGEEGFVVGRAALTGARISPERFERSPKRLVGQKAALLGDEAVPVVDLVAAVLRRTFEAACTREGDTTPAWVRLTHPAIWQQERLDVLRAAAHKAGLGDCQLMSEPEAAAWFFVADHRGNEPVVAEGQSIAMYDLGGGTFDTAILRRDEHGFSLAGQPGGDDWFGGEDFDQRLLDHVLRQLRDRDPGAASQLARPLNARWQRARLQLQRDVRDAKEALSSTARVSVPVTAGDDEVDIEITRGEFEDLIHEDLQRTVAIMESTIHRAGLERDDIAAIYMTGGSSRIPLAAALLAQLHPRTYTRPDPKTVVVQGAAMVPGEASEAAAEGSRAAAASATQMRQATAEAVRERPAAPPKPAPVPAPARTPTEAPGRPRRRLLVAMPLALALGTGVVLGVATIGGSSSDGSDDLTNASSSSSLTLRHPASWAQAASPPRIPGLELSDAVWLSPKGSAQRSGLVAGLTDARGLLLLPGELVSALGKPPARDDRVKLGALQAYRYRDLTARGMEASVTLFASPTTKGVATIACYGPVPTGPELRDECERIAASVRLRGGKPLALGPDTGYGRVLRRAVDALNSTRPSRRRSLRRAKTPQGQAAAADGLAAAHREAARILARARPTPLDSAVHARLLGALRDAGAGYSAMASAVRGDNRSAFASAASRVRRADATLQVTLRDLQRHGYRPR